jgi:hypothetical protein
MTSRQSANISRSSREPVKVGLLKRGIYFVAEVVDDDFGLSANIIFFPIITNDNSSNLFAAASRYAEKCCIRATARCHSADHR